MNDRFLQFVIGQRWLVLLATLAMAAVGLWSATRLAIDAVPDITNVQVQINTTAAGYSPLESEQRVTFPVENALAGLPGLQQTRSISRYGLSQVTAVFRDGTDLYFARQLVGERLQQVREQLPAGVAPELGPVSTGLGEILMWTVETVPGARKPDGSAYTPMDLREAQDWIVAPRLRQVRGVTEVNTIGGQVREFVVAPRTADLAARGLALEDLVRALERNNASVGAGYIERNGEQVLVRAPGQLGSLTDLQAVVVARVQGTAVQVRDVADVAWGAQPRTGAATENGAEVVLGTVFMLVGENSREVARAVGRRLQEINRALPPGLVARTVYDRTVLVEKTIATVTRNLAEGALLVVVVLFLFLGNLRAALITAAVIPLSMLFTFTGMAGNRVSANLMSLGALDFGLIVDGAVVIVEACVRRLAQAQAREGRLLSLDERLRAVFEAARESRRPLLFGQLIIMVVYLPVFALSGVEGKMFHPMAYTVVTALLGAMLLSVTFVPAAVALLLNGPVQEGESRLMARAHRLYAPVLQATLGRLPLVLAAAGAALALACLLAWRSGSEFIPSLDEHDIALHAMRIPGTSLTQAVRMQTQLEATLRAMPEVDKVFAKIGTAEVATDPMPPNVADVFVMLKPRKQWPDPRKPKPALVAEMEQALARVPGNNYEFTQPIQMRFNELISGVRSDVAVKVFGDDPDVLQREARRIAAVLRGVGGAADVKVEQTGGLGLLSVEVDRERAARFGLDAAQVQETVATAIGGREAGTVFEGDRRFAVVVRLDEAQRADAATLEALPIALPAEDGQPRGFVRLADVAQLRETTGPSQISREDGKRSVVVSANVRGRDLGSFVQAARGRLATTPLPAGYWSDWGGSFEQLESAAQRLAVVVPAALLLVLALLYAMFGRLKDGLLVFTGVPFALTGGIAALWLRGLPLSIPAGVGFIALSGVAVLNGLVMLWAIRGLREQGMALDEAVRAGALQRLRPVLMTALVAALGFVPMAVAVGTGAEVQRPLATVVIGGILSSTLLTLLVLPALYRAVHRREAAAAQGPAQALRADAGAA